jgi:hypothetical protein
MVPGDGEAVAGSAGVTSGAAFAGAAGAGASAAGACAAGPGAAGVVSGAEGEAGAVVVAGNFCCGAGCASTTPCGANRTNDSAAAASDRKCKFISYPSRGIAGRRWWSGAGRIAASDHVFNRKSETEINNDSFYPFQPWFRNDAQTLQMHCHSRWCDPSSLNVVPAKKIGNQAR